MLKAELKVVGGRHHGRIIPLTSPKFLVGREQDCLLRPNSEMVSRHHCVFVSDDYTVRLRDLGSTNGTFVNNEQIRGIVTLKQSDLIRIGKLDLELVIYPTADTEAEVAPTDSETVRLAGSETSLLPGLNDSTVGGLSGSGDTTVFMSVPSMEEGSDTGDSTANIPAESLPEEQPSAPAEEAPVVAEQPPAPAAPVPAEGAVPQPGYPQQMPPGYPQQPYVQQPQPGYPYGYPQQPMPGYPMMPQPGYPAQPGYPQYQAYPQQPMPGMPAQPESTIEMEEPVADPSSKVDAPPVQLPDPSTTGAKEDVVIGSDPTAENAKPEGEGEEAKEGESKGEPTPGVSDAIDSIFKKMNNRIQG